MGDFRRQQAGQFREREVILAEGRPDSVLSAVKDEEAPRRRQANVEYGFCYPVNRSFTMCHPLTL